MKTLIQRILDPSRRDSDADSTSESEAADLPRTAELEPLEPRMLFSAAPVEAPDAEAEAQPEPGAGEAADESVVVSPVAAQSAAAALTDAESTQEGLAGNSTLSDQNLAPDGQSQVDGNQAVTLVDLNEETAILNQETLQAIADAAAERWRATGLTAEQSDTLDNISYEIADLGGTRLGKANGLTISIDDDAAGSDAWFVDATPLVDEEFIPTSPTQRIAPSGTEARGQYDLLSVLLHEQGHLLGLTDLSGDGEDVMNDLLSRGERRIAAQGDAEGSLPGAVSGVDFMSTAPGEQIFFKTFGGGLSEKVTEIHVDSSGNTYLRGTVRGTTVNDFAGNPINGLQGGNDGFVAKLDASGNQLFFKTFGGSENDSVKDFHVDSSGNTYIGGAVRGTTAKDFAGIPINGLQGGNDGFVAKLDASGNQLFFKTFGGSELSDLVQDFHVDSSGNTYIGGTVQGTTANDFAGDPINGLQGGNDGFVAKLDASGNQLFFKTFGGSENDSVEDFHVDSSGNTYIGGTVQDTTVKDFADNSIPLQNNASIFSPSDGFVAKLDASGNQLFFKTFGGSELDLVQDFHVDSSGNTYIGGTVRGTTVNDFAGNPINGLQGSNDGFVAKLDASGNQLFFKTFGGAISDYVRTIHVDSSGNSYIEGTVRGTTANDFAGDPINGLQGSSDGFVAKLDASGNQLFFKTFGGSELDLVQDFHVDSSGNTYIGGTVQDTTANDFAGDPINGLQGGNDGFVAKLDASGNQVFFETFGGPEGGGGPSESLHDILVDSSGNVFVTGAVAGTTANDFAGIPITGLQGENDGFVAKLDASGNQVFFETFGGPEGDNNFGTGNDRPNDIHVDPSGNVFVTGTVSNTTANDFAGNPITGLQGGDDIFVAKLSGGAPPPPAENTASVDAGGNATILADGDADALTLSVDALGNLKIASGGSIAAGDGATADDAGNVFIPITGLSTLTIDLRDGDDTLVINALTGFTGALDIMGGDGQDAITFKAEVTLDTDNSATFATEEIKFWVGSRLTTTGSGDIIALAEGGTGNLQGVHVYGAELRADGTGKVSLTGEGGGTGNSNIGVNVTNGGTITTASGNIDLIGQGGGAAGSVGSKGVQILTGSSLSAGGGGIITIEGTAGDGTLQNDGVSITGADLTVADGGMTITGTGKGTMGGDGVAMSGTDLVGTGGGYILITGTSRATGGSNNQGVQLSNTTIDTSAGTGTITLSGSGSVDSLSNNEGVRLANVDIATGGNAAIDIDGVAGGTAMGINNTGVALLTGSTVVADGTGTVDIDGTGGNSRMMNRGVYMTGAGSEVKSTSGVITVNGTGKGSLSFNRGIETGFATISTTGAINMTGIGSVAATGIFNSGISLTSSTVGASSSNLVLLGTAGGGSSFNQGIRLVSSTIGNMFGGLTLTGTGGGSGVLNNGVYILGGTLNGTGATITGTSGGGTILNQSVYILNVGTSTLGLGNVLPGGGGPLATDDPFVRFIIIP